MTNRTNFNTNPGSILLLKSIKILRNTKILIIFEPIHIVTLLQNRFFFKRMFRVTEL